MPPSKLKKYPIWGGPDGNGPNCGITYSLLSRFLCCRERFRLLVVEGLRPADQFNHRIEYGQLWHTCEEALARGNDPTRGNKTDRAVPLWEHDLKKYAAQLITRYPLQQEQVAHWYEVCRVQFPLYVDYWARHPDEQHRTPLLQEQVFDVPYTLPSRRTVRLRGKWDAVDLIGSGKGAGIYLQENKTKSDIHEERLRRQLTFDLQTMLYLVALQSADGYLPTKGATVAGVRYNVVRRPLSGGKGTIVRHKPTKSNPAGESKESYYARLKGIIKDEPETYFMRWRAEVTPGDVARFRRECLDPILEQLCDWWEWVAYLHPEDHFHSGESGGYSKKLRDRRIVGRYVGNPPHWRHPFGVYNVLDEGGSSDLDEYLATGSQAGLVRTETLFGELG